jgi:hypothetical protein
MHCTSVQPNTDKSEQLFMELLKAYGFLPYCDGYTPLYGGQNYF